MRSFHYLSVLISMLLSITVYAAADDVMLKMFYDRVRSIDRAADWRLVDQDAKRDTEFYYDNKSISDTTRNTKEVYFKIAYKSQQAIAELEKRRICLGSDFRIDILSTDGRGSHVML
jgi:hypothetical protein